MTRRAGALPLVAAMTWAIAITAVLAPGFALGAAALLCLAVAGTAVWCLRRPARALVVLALALAAAAGTAGVVGAAEPGRAEARALVAGEASVSAHVTVTGRAEQTPSGEVWFDATSRVLTAGRGAMSAAVPVRLGTKAAAGIRIGAQIVVRGAAWAPDPGERAALVLRASGPAEVVAPADGLWAVLAGLRERLAETARTFPPPGSALIPGLAVGDTDAVGEELGAAMTAASLTHLTAVSGANCAIVVGLAFGVAALCRAPRAVRVAAGLGTLTLFVLLVTPEPSVVRAACMAAVAMLAVGLGRPVAGLSLLSITVTVLLILDPWLALSLGFALSVVATASLLVLARPLARGLARWLPMPLALAIAVPLAAQVACAPLVALRDPSVPLLGVVANMLAAPAAPLATVGGFFACLLGFLPALQHLLVGLAWLPAAWIGAVAEAVAAIPGQRVPWLAGPRGALLLVVVGAALVVVVVPVRRLRAPRVIGALILAVATGLVGAQAALVSVAAPWTTPAAWQVAVCDVGQGDALLLRSAGAVALVDTGPDPALLRTCLRSYGVDHLDLLVLTHFDADHAGGAEAVRGAVDVVVHGPPDVDGAVLLGRLEAGGATVRPVVRGDGGELGSARWQVLWPPSPTAAPGNDASVVLHVSGAEIPDTLLLGDLSAEPQARLRSSVTGLGIDVVKVAHHGSADQDDRLYDAIGARLALIPVGAGNDYGHPRARLLELLRATGAVVARTDRDGTLAVWREEDGLRLWRAHEVGPAD